MTATSPAGAFLDAFTVVDAFEPTLVTWCFAEETEANILLSGYPPNSEVLLAQYECCGWEGESNIFDAYYVFVDDSGTLQTSVLLEPQTLVAGFVPGDEAYDFTGQVAGYNGCFP